MAAATASRVVLLDGMRGLGILLVLVYHAFPVVMRGGNLGVDVLFVLSGYFVTRSLLRGSNSVSWPELRQFWNRRAKRLVPALALAMLGTTALAVLLAPELPSDLAGQWLAAILWATNWSMLLGNASYFAKFEPKFWQHLWSVGVEAQFYLVWPLLVIAVLWLLRRRLKRFVSYALYLLALLLSGASLTIGIWLATNQVDVSRIYLGSDSHAFGLFLGAAIALVPSIKLTSARALRIGTAIATALCLGVTALAIFAPSDTPAKVLTVLPLASLLVALLVLLVKFGAATKVPGISSKPMIWLGGRSYAIYLWHWPLLILARMAFPKLSDPVALMRDALAVVLALVLAELSWRYVEEPILVNGWKRSFAKLRTAPNWLANHPFAAFGIFTVALLLVAAAVGALLLSPAPLQLEENW